MTSDSGASKAPSLTEAEALASQLGTDDLQVLSQAADEDEGDGVLCPNVYCLGGYSGPNVSEPVTTDS